MDPPPKEVDLIALFYLGGVPFAIVSVLSNHCVSPVKLPIMRQVGNLERRALNHLVPERRSQKVLISVSICGIIVA